MEESPREKRRIIELKALVGDCDQNDESDGLDDHIRRVGSEVLGRDLRPFQVECASYLLNGGATNKVLAMMWPPGAGKSLTYIVAGCIACGVTLIFQPTLTLSADQVSKLRQLPENASVAAFNLDDYKTPGEWNVVEGRIRRATFDVPESSLPPIFLVVSPQCASDSKRPWRKLFLDLARAGLLRLMVIDELHLVREQGETLRPEFSQLGKSVIAEVKKVSPMTPIVLFSATVQLPDLVFVERMFSSNITRISWAPPRAMQKRNIFISFVCRSMYSSVAKSIMKDVISDPSKKLMAFVDFKVDVANTAGAIRDIASGIKDCDMDCLEITGDDPPEQKAFNINIFCNNVTTPAEKEAARLYGALAGTSGCVSTGVDPRGVVLVSRRGCPPSPSAMFQELGRLSRGDVIPGWRYTYHMTLDVSSYARLVWRIETTPNATRAEKDRNLANLLLALKMVVLDDTCLHYALEVMFGRPDAIETMPSACNGMCPRCSGVRNAESFPFLIKPLKKSLLKVFNEPAAVKLGGTQDASYFAAKLRAVSIDEGVWVDRKAKTTARKTIEAHAVEMLVLQLLAAGIIEHFTETAKDKNGNDVTVVLVRGVMNKEETGYLFSDDEAYEIISNATLTSI